MRLLGNCKDDAGRTVDAAVTPLELSSFRHAGHIFQQHGAQVVPHNWNLPQVFDHALGVGAWVDIEIVSVPATESKLATRPEVAIEATWIRGM